MKQIKLHIDGMHCASCAGNVQKSLTVVKGVRNAKVSLLFKKADVEADDNVSVDEIKKAVSKFGYKVSELK